MTGGLKRGIEWILCRSFVGHIVSRLAGDWIESPSVPRGWKAVRVLAPRSSVSTETRASLFWGFHEAQEIRYVKSHLPSNLPVVELGTSLGALSAHIARRLEGKRKLICVEANAEILALARETIAANASNLDLMTIAAAIDYSGTGTRSFSVSNDLISSHVAQENEAGIQVPEISLSGVLEQANVSEYVLVCDIEGAELEVLERDAGALSGCRMMIIELHSGERASIEQIAGMIEEAGFKRTAQHGAVFVFSRA